MKIYLGILYEGSYDDKEKKIVFVGTNRKKAIKTIKENFNPKADNSYGYLEIWENESNIDNILICE